jgi:hypothetical protein
MWFEVRHRIIEILKTLTPVAETTYTVSDSTPPFRADFHGYLVNVRPRQDAVTAPAFEIRNHEMNFTIKCFSPQILTGVKIVNDYRMDAYADAITAVMERYPRLESALRVPLSGVVKTLLGGAVFQSPVPYPDGQQLQQYETVTFNLQVTFKRSTGC